MKPRRGKPSRDPGIEHEPHLRGAPFEPDPSEQAAARHLERSARGETVDDHVERSVWDEPALAPQLSGAAPPDALTYASWLDARRAETGWGRSWSVTLGTAASAGPLAVLGTLCGTWSLGAWSWFGIVSVTVLGPILEEMMKVALALWIVEKRPFLFRSRVQITACVLAGGFVFAAMENVLYLVVDASDPPPGLVQWRWTVCVAMHMICSAVAGLGLVRIWSGAMVTRSRPQLAAGAPFLIAAAVLHGAYNAVAVLLDAVSFRF